MTDREAEGILTLEPLMEAVRAGVERAGWELSGMQKTTSHQFEGRWEGESTRSAYLFFHSPDAFHDMSIDVYLDETSRGLTGNLALVVDLVALGPLGDPRTALAELGRLSARTLPGRYATPLTLRLRLQDGADESDGAEAEVRFKLRIPRKAIAEGADAVADLAESTMGAFVRIATSPDLARYRVEE